MADGLSVVAAVRNEASQIREFLEQVRFAGEVIVVDMESDDGTAEACREVADRVIVHDGGPHRLIHVNKNVGIDAARGPWILDLDADERLTPELRAEIVAVVRSSDSPFAAYALPFTHYFFGKYLQHGGFRDRHVRLFRKDRFRYPEDRAHSSPVVDGEIGNLEHLVVHFNHPTVRSFVEKLNRYTSSDAPLMLEHGRGGLRNRSLPRPIGIKLATAPLSVFWSRFVRHRGFRDGVHGFVVAALLAFYQFVEYAKVWELQNAPPADGR